MRRLGLLTLLMLAAFAAPASAAPTINVQIVGGTFAAPGQFPFMASLMQSSARRAEKGFFCGGSVIAPRVILTAAHCFEDTPPSAVDVVVGRTRMSARLTGARVDVSGILVHPGWNPGTMRNDIALVQLARPVAIAPIALAVDDADPAGLPPTRLTTSGWGTTTEGGAISDGLRFVKLTVRAAQPCTALYPDFTDEGQLCAGSSRAGEDSCQGDSGGPLFTGERTEARILGIVSYGLGCGREGVPGVYTRVSDQTDWLSANVSALNDGATSPPPPVDPPRVTIRSVRCGAVFCNVALRTTPRAPAGGIVVNATRARRGSRKAVDRRVDAREVAPGRWTARINLPVGRVSLYAFPFAADRKTLDGEGDVQKFVISVG
jgi:secreted trypsin-like serine protease